MSPRLRPVLLIALTAVSLAALAWAPSAPGAGLAERALALLGLPAERFARVPHEPPFDWSTDGCSRTPPAWARAFRQACRQHDFGYRNLGRGLRLRPTEAARAWVDARLLAELRRICARRCAARPRAACRARAWAMYLAVRAFGPRWRPGPRRAP